MTKELLTASRMAKMLTCPRSHFWAYEKGLRRAVDAIALRFGSAWHNAMEARWKGLDPFNAAVEGAELDEMTLATLTAMLRGYVARYGDTEDIQVHPEIEFRHPIDGSRTFDAGGKIDGLAVLNGTQLLVEHKTTSSDIGVDSDYWLRLRANPQLFQYVLAARASGWEIREVMYDVTRKPTIRPRQIPILDDDGLKIVLENDSGDRARNKNGSPRQTGGESFTLQTRDETPEEFGERLYADTLERPDFYFQRRSVPILDDDLEEFEAQRVQVARMILDRRRQEKPEAPWRAWPRNLNGMTCVWCEFSSFCLQNTIPELSHPPAGFVVGQSHQELEFASE